MSVEKLNQRPAARRASGDPVFPKVGFFTSKAWKKKIAEGHCPARKDQTHCEHWWDGDRPCCNCGDNTP